MIQVSFIVPVYNVEKYLDKCVESLVSQTLKQIEIILINDGSIDSSGEICDKWKLKDSRVKVIHQNNTGVSGARNRGMEIATGEYIAFVDSDDWIATNFCEKMYTNAKQNDAQIVHANYFRVENEKYIEIKNKFSANNFMEKADIKEILMRAHKNRIIWFVYLNLYKTNFLKKNNIKFNEKIFLGEDGPFNLEAFSRADRMFFLEDSLYYYRRNPDSLTQVNYKRDLLKKLEEQYTYKKQIYSENNLINKISVKDLRINYIEHILVMLISNVYNGPKDIDRIAELKTIRQSDMIAESLKGYQIIKCRKSLGIVLMILLMKYRGFSILDKMMLVKLGCNYKNF